MTVLLVDPVSNNTERNRMATLTHSCLSVIARPLLKKTVKPIKKVRVRERLQLWAVI